jgi:hypothetical protein
MVLLNTTLHFLALSPFHATLACRGSVAAVLLCLLPVFFLLATTLIKPIMLPSSTALPLSAALLALIRLTYLSSPPLLVLAHTVVGALEGLVPLAVIFGAILLFEVMAATGCLQFMMANVRCLSAGCPIAEVFLIGWAFAYTISGAHNQASATQMCVIIGLPSPLRGMGCQINSNIYQPLALVRCWQKLLLEAHIALPTLQLYTASDWHP